MTPNDIDILVHYHCCCDEHERIAAPAVRDAIAWMLREGLLVERKITQRGSSYATTERGSVLVEAWCSQPLPVQVWVIPERKDLP